MLTVQALQNLTETEMNAVTALVNNTANSREHAFACEVVKHFAEELNVIRPRALAILSSYVAEQAEVTTSPCEALLELAPEEVDTIRDSIDNGRASDLLSETVAHVAEELHVPRYAALKKVAVYSHQMH